MFFRIYKIGEKYELFKFLIKQGNKYNFKILKFDDWRIISINILCDCYI